MGNKRRPRPDDSAAPSLPQGFSDVRNTEDWAPDLQKTKAYEKILMDIILGILPPNARLDELGLADQYDLGVAGVRDALARLSLEGMVLRRPRSGTIVTSIDVQEVQQSYEVRCLLEPHAAFLAAQNATAAEKRKILTAFDGAETAAERRDFRAIIAMDQKFHRTVAIASHNLSLARIVINIHNKAARYWYHTMTLQPDEDRLEDIASHRVVAQAIARGDGPAAMQAMFTVMGDKNVS